MFQAYESIFGNWEIENDEWNFRSSLERFGLTLVELGVEDREQFDTAVKNAIDSDSTLLFLPVYNTMFYSTSYRSKAVVQHGMVICGYDEERGLYIIRENVHVTEPNAISITPFYKFHIKKELIWEMWEESRVQLHNSKSMLYRMVKVADSDKTEDDSKSPYLEMLHVLSLINPEKDRLLNKLEVLNQVIEETSSDEMEEIDKYWHRDPYAVSIRRTHFNALHAMADFLKGMQEESCTQALDEFMGKREHLVNKILRLLCKHKPLSEMQLESIRNEIIETNQRFLATFSEKR